MALFVGNNHLGFLTSLKNGTFLHNSDSKSSFYPKPISLIHFNFFFPNKTSISHKKRDNYRVDSSSVSNGEISSIEKELKFSPSFSDYVKIMESVKVDRSNNSEGDFDKRNSKRNIKRKVSSFSTDFKGNKKIGGLEKGFIKENERVKPKDFNQSVNKRNFGSSERNFGSSERNFDSSERNVGSIKFGHNNFERKNEREDYSYGKIIAPKEKRLNNMPYKRGQFDQLIEQNAPKDKFISKSDSFRKEKSENRYEIYQTGENKSYQKIGYNNFERKKERENDSCREKRLNNAQNKMGQFDQLIEHNTPKDKFINKSDSFRNENSEKRYEINQTGERKSHQKNRYSSLKSSSNNNDSKFKRIGGNYYTPEKDKEKYGKIIKRESKSGRTDFDERAAFKTFEVFTDVNNRPRVLRMEMEERIQKLASRLNATDVNMPAWQFSKLMHGAKIKFSDHTILRVVQILGKYKNWRRSLQVLQWLQSGDKFKSYKSRYIYTTVLDVLGKAKRPFEALNVFHSMLEEFGSYPDRAAYDCMAVILGQAGLMKELFDLMDCMRKSPDKKKFDLGPIETWDPRLEPDLVVYNAVLNACVQQKQWEGAFWVLQQLKEKCIKPTNTTYGLVMEVMLVCEKYNLVYEFFHKVKKSNIPSALNYKILINAFWKEGKIEEAIEAVKEMERKGIVGTASLYYDFARCLCTAGRLQEALVQVDKICKVAKKPLVVTYTGLIQACIDSNNMKYARYIFNNMQKYCSPNVITCNIMVKSYLQNNMFDEGKDLFYEIVNGVSDINGKSDLRGKVVPDKFMFNIMMESCAENKKWEDFARAFLQMLQHGYHFDAKRHLKMVMDAFRAGKVEVLEATWDHLLSFGRTPPVPILMERFCLKLKEGNISSALSCVRNFEESELRNISSKAWLHLLLNNKECLEEKVVVKLVGEINEISECNESVSVVYKKILSGCSLFISEGTQLCNLEIVDR
ncbi:hypothetical protein LUZ60_009034 [Juncus effusus]|nr:hypothetical protein LUZ60_009034 [Juncus effusus]